MDYKSAGVNIDAGKKSVALISDSVKRTYNENVLSSLGNFAGCFELGSAYKNPVLVSCTDGVGTKLKIALEYGILDTIGIDLVAMSANDLICSGAKPLFFLDYIAVNTLVPEQMRDIVSGISKGCIETNMALLGGEMAEMSDIYQKGEFDLAGFAVGIVEKDNLIDGSAISEGDYCYALASSGLHSNGYSLVRYVIKENPGISLSKNDLLNPTKLYTAMIQKHVIQGSYIVGIAHITGGGIQDNLSRILPKSVNALIAKNAVNIPSIFNDIQQAGDISDEEMYRVFNMGVGMIVVSKEVILDSDFILMGRIQKGQGDVVFT